MNACGESQEDVQAAKKVEALKQEIQEEKPKQEISTPKEVEKNTFPKESKKEVLNDTNTSKKEDGFMKKIGFSSKDGTISLDTHKAKDYFKDLGEDIKDKSKELSTDIKEKTLTVTKGMGIEMDKNGSLRVDTNKTKTFMKNMSDKMENIAKDVDTFAREVIKDKNITR